MKITDLVSRGLIRQKNNLTEESSSNQSKNRPSVAGEDRISISPEARKFQQISRIVAEDDAARAEKVRALKERIQNGDYSIDNQSVAGAILGFNRND